MSTPLRFPRGLYGITPEWTNTEQLIIAVAEAAQGGMVALQWRRKTGLRSELMAQALALAECCKQHGILFIINDNLQLALAIDADGVHLGRGDGSLAEARRALGPSKIVGCSCYNEPELARQALSQDVDYIAFGAMYPSRVKPDTTMATLHNLREGRKLTESQGHTPRAAVVAIGGITADNAAPLIQAGADSIALISGLFEAPDIQASAARCRDLFRT